MFALDRALVLDRVRGLAERSAPDIAVALVDTAAEDALARRSLQPWLPGYQLVGMPRDPEGLERARARRRLERASILALAVVSIATGVVLTAHAQIESPPRPMPPAVAAPVRPRVRLKQGLMRVVFGADSKLSFDDQCREAAKVGFKGFDLIPEQDWPTLAKHGLVPTMAGAGPVTR